MAVNTNLCKLSNVCCLLKLVGSVSDVYGPEKQLNACLQQRLTSSHLISPCFLLALFKARFSLVV